MRREFEAAASFLGDLGLMVLAIDREGRVVAGTDANTTFGREITGTRFCDLLVDTDRERACDVVEEVLRTGIARTTDVALATESGRRYALLLARPRRDEGALIGATLTLVDVTERRLEEERLRNNERMMTDAQGVAHIGTWEWDISQPHAYWSPELYAMYGLDPATHVPTYDDYLTRVHPDDRERVKTATERVFNDRLPYSHDERVFRGDGEMRYLHTWAEAGVDEHGNLVRLIGVCLDVTDRKLAELKLEESEARSRAIFEHAPTGIATFDVTGVLVEANPVSHRLFGSSDLVGRSIESLVTEVDAARASFASVLSDARGGAVTFDSPLRQPGDAVVWGRIVLTHVSATERRAPFVLAMIEDVSNEHAALEARTLADSRLSQIEALEERTEWKSRLLGFASHEIRNPLTPLQLHLDLLLEGAQGPLQPGQEQLVRLVRLQTERLSKLVSSLLDVERLDRGPFSLARRETDVAEILDRVVASLSGAATRWGVRLSHARPPQLLAFVDPDRIEQVLFNLLTNALKFTPRGESVHVALVGTNDAITFAVTDHGQGMSEEQVATLFIPFSRVARAVESREYGTGLGLYITKSIVEAHGGRVWAESKLGEGSVFHVEIPRVASREG